MSTHNTFPQPRTGSSVRRMVAAHPLGAFFGLAFTLSWLVVLPLLLGRLGVPGFPADLPVEPFQMAGAFAGPTLAAFIVTAALEGRLGVRQLLRRYIQWRVGLRWYLLVFLGPLVALTLGAVPFLGISIVVEFIRNLPLVLTVFLPFLIAGILLGPLWEEPGWRGFALPRLQARYGPLAGTLLLGLLWGLWHLPGFLGGWLGPLTVSSLAALLLGTGASAVIMTWVYNNTGGSLLIMILLHGSFNAAVAFGGQLLPAQLPEPIHTLVYSGWIPAVTYTLSALLIVLHTRGRLGYRLANPAQPPRPLSPPHA